MWTPIIYSYFHPKFRKAAKAYIEQGVSLMIHGIIGRLFTILVVTSIIFSHPSFIFSNRFCAVVNHPNLVAVTMEKMDNIP